MDNNIFTRLFLGLIYLFEPLYKIFSWIFWIITNIDIFNNYNNFKNKVTHKMFSK